MRIFLVCLLKLVTGLSGRLYRWAAGSAITAAADLLNHSWPRRTETRYLRAICLQALGRPVSALTDFEAALQRNPARLDSLQGKAECLIECERYKDAAETAAWGLKLKPDHEELLTAAVRPRLRAPRRRLLRPGR
ncbi:MAG: tetratricopeptide repeat protein [Elusimicrobiota bacterium]|nr:tetratricopeptide repeat protein [Elusimicrobiota bacterium]